MEILLFSHEPAYAGAAVAAGVAGVIVDWESRGKERRQQGWDTEINHGTQSDLGAIAAVAPGRAICRINNHPAQRDSECDAAIAGGAVEILLPMVRGIGEVESVLRHVDGRAGVGVLVETRQAMALGRELEGLPLTRVYVGLHDFRIDSGGRGLFDPLVDGTLDRFRAAYAGSLGVAGVTAVAHGTPIPQRLLLAAMARLRCDFGVARRSFRRDVPPERMGDALAGIDAEMRRLHARDPEQVADDQRTLQAMLRDDEAPAVDLAVAV